ncbi:MAG: hypothetical protein IJS15_15625 [Victivallales bacterium]|nr:hypothetical protein [Victivallales bacterium]
MRFAILMVLVAFAFAGCVKMGGGSSSSLPWSQPADWENQSLGVPL